MSVSIVIPTLNEAAGIAETLHHVATVAPDAERIVVDGGSEDDTAELAAPHARVIHGPRGRASQLNAGAAVASGAWLLFLHADTRLPVDFRNALDDAARHGCEAGAFRLTIRGRHPLLPLLAWGATWRTRLSGIAYGDQALFVRTARFGALGGFPEQPLMEDVAFTRRLRAEGIHLWLARQTVVTDGRRWDRDGFWRTWWLMRRLTWHYRRDGDAAAVARDYRDVR